MSKTRIVQLDLIRTIAIVSVVLRHASETFYWGPLMEQSSPLSFSSELSGVVLFTLGRVGVPLFLMLTGYLLLPRNYLREDVGGFVRRRWIPLLLCLELWIVIWTVVSVLSGGRPFDIEELLESMLLLRNFDRVNSVWYLYQILGLYLILPIIARGLSGLLPRDLSAPALISFMLFFVLPSIRKVGMALGIEGLSIPMGGGFTGGAYGLYLLVGWSLRKDLLSNAENRVLATVAAVSLSALVLLQLRLFDSGHSYDLYYEDPLLCIGCSALFELLTRVSSISCPKIVLSISTLSFGIYLIHKPVQMVLSSWAKSWGSSLPVSVLLFAALLFVASWGISTALSKIPLVGKKLLYLK